MAEIRPPLITSDAFSPWAATVHNSVKERTLIRSNDVNSSVSPFGTFVGLRNEQVYTSIYTRYTGEFDPTASYNVNDIVRVLPGKKYDLPWDTPPIHSIDTQGIFTLIPGTPYLDGYVEGVKIRVPDFRPIPGVYVCSAGVPSFWFLINALKFFNFQVPVPGVLWARGAYNSFNPSGVIRTNLYSLRFTNVNYFPVWPELPNQATNNLIDLSSFNGRYWDLISLLPTQTFICSNGISEPTFTDTQTVPSGSANFTGSAP